MIQSKHKTSLKNQGLDDIKISAAAEYMMDEQFIELLGKGDILTLKDNFILVEKLRLYFVENY